MDEKYLALAVPVFIVSMTAEGVIARKQGKRLYRLHDTIGSLACGIGQTLLGFWMNVLVIGTYVFVATFKLWDASALPHWALFAGSLVFVDFCHYWFHRASHRVNFLGAGHAVHHQSEEYNLSTALRQSWLEPLMSVPFYLPMAIAGVPVEMFVVTHTLQTLYQYWIHTRLVGSLGVVDRVLNTPSNHRVHHAINPEYIDKNYAGILILWDRIFGTWVPEKATPAYGLVKPLSSFNPFWANLSEWARIAALSYGSKTTREAMFAPFAPPEWLPRSMGGTQDVPPVNPSRRLFDTNPGAKADRYVMVQFGLVLAATGLLLRLTPRIEPVWHAGWIVWLLFGLGTLAGLMHGARWAMVLERLRLALAPIMLAGVLGWGGGGGGAVFLLVSEIARRRLSTRT